MDAATVQAYCLAKPGATPDQPWENDLVMKVGGKIFAFLGDTSVGIKCGRDRDDADELCHRFPADASSMPYIGRFGWNTVQIAGAVPDGELEELIDTSYDLVVSKLPKAKRP